MGSNEKKKHGRTEELAISKPFLGGKYLLLFRYSLNQWIALFLPIIAMADLMLNCCEILFEKVTNIFCLALVCGA